MQKEIFEQPESVFNTMRGRVNFETNTGNPSSVPWASVPSLCRVSINALHVSCSAPGWLEGPLEGDQTMPTTHCDWLWNQLPCRCGRKCNMLLMMQWEMVSA